jgi:hypothetical protein
MTLARTHNILVLAALAGVTCSAPGVHEDGAVIAQDLKSVQRLKVYFGHQSVGGNILEGLREIEAKYGRGPEMTDSLIGQNGDPAGKCEDFTRNLGRLASQHLDVALMKFCYIDFDQATDVEKLFAKYSGTLDAMEKQYPEILFVPVTAPLTTRGAGWKRAGRAA